MYGFQWLHRVMMFRVIYAISNKNDNLLQSHTLELQWMPSSYSEVVELFYQHSVVKVLRLMVEGVHQRVAATVFTAVVQLHLVGQILSL